MTTATESAGARETKRERIRAAMAWKHPGGWWRRELILAVLESVWPRWMTAPEIAAIAGEVDPRARQGWDRRRPHGRDSYVITRMVLMRLHDQRVIDRIGVRVHHAPQVRLSGVPATGQHPRVKWQRGAGYRYRIRDEWRGLR